MLHLRSFGACVALCLPLGLAAQDAVVGERALAPVLAGAPSHGLPGQAAGSERWVVHFQQRTFTLDGFRTAILTRQPVAQVAGIVAGLEASMRVDQAAFVAAAEALGARVVAQWWLVNAAAVEVTPAQLDAVRRLPNIAFVEPDQAADAVILAATNASNHNADLLQAQGHRGAGVAVGIMDTGQDEDVGGAGRPHRTYFVSGDPNNLTGGGIGGSRLMVNRQIGALIADDQNGHGTGVASIAAGADWGTGGGDDGHAPLASICGYAIANQVSGGGSSTTTMATAWQSMAADRAAFNIVAANLSYGGSPQATAVDQQALDSAALNADIMCCAAAGNSGTGGTAGSQGAANGLAVAAVNANSHTVASFSSRGPLSGDTTRFYPDIAACGVSTVMAGRDNEGGNFVASGTSMASPMVAGAATQLRARFPALSALETKAVLLASSVSIAAQNPSLDRNAYGMGLLRNDRAHDLVGNGNFGTASLTAAAPTHTFQVPVVAGRTYTVAVTWHRLALGSSAWSDLDLVALAGDGFPLAQSATPRNLYELVRFTALTTGNLDVRTTLTSLSGGAAQPFAFAWTESPAQPVQGSAIAFGAGCPGTGQGPAECASINLAGGTLTSAFRTNEYCYTLNAPSPLQVTSVRVFTRTNAGAPVTVTASIYGNAGGTPSTAALATAPMTVGTTAGFYTATFALPVAVPAGQFWVGVDHSGNNTNVSTLTAGTGGTGYYRATPGSGAWTLSTLVARPSVAVTCLQAGGAEPRLTAGGTLRVGTTVQWQLASAPANAAAFLGIGFSAATSPFGPLPFALPGAPGCDLRTSGEALNLLFANGSGAAVGNLAVPNLAVFVGTIFYGQYGVLDASVNALGITVSNGLRVLLGA
jgi:hypothetical protein